MKRWKPKKQKTPIFETEAHLHQRVCRESSRFTGGCGVFGLDDVAVPRVTPRNPPQGPRKAGPYAWKNKDKKD